MAEAGPLKCKPYVRLFGSFRLLGHEGKPVAIAGRRTRALFAYLLLCAEGTAQREKLCGLFWSDRGDAQARSSLRQCVLELKTVLADAGIDALVAARETVALRPDLIDCDVSEFERLLATRDVAAIIGMIDRIGRASLLEDLELPGLFRDWLDQTRARVNRDMAGGITALLDQLAAAEDWANLAHISDAWLRRDPFDEAVVAAAIRADVASGASAAAHRRFHALAVLLDKELGVQPGPLVSAALAGEGSLSVRAAVAPAHSAEPLLAVMAFDNLSSDPDMDYFSEGISEEILQNVARTTALKVIARTSSFQFRGRDKVTANIVSKLGASHLLDGSVRRSGSMVRISTALIDCATQTTLWSGRFDRELSDIFAVQDEIAAAVATGLQRVFSPAAPKQPVDPVAYDLYLRARSLAALPSHVDECLNLLSQAVAREPDFAAAWSSLAMARAVKARWMTPADQFDEVRDAVLLAAARATMLDPDAGLPLGALSLIEPDGFFAAREALLERALTLAPYDPEILKQATDFACSVGRLEESYRYAERATEIDPLNPLIAAVCAQALLDLGRPPDEGHRVFEDLRQRWPDLDWLVAMPMLLAASVGDWERANALWALPEGESREYRMARQTVSLLKGPKDVLIAHVRASVAKQLAKSGRIEIRTLVFMHNNGLEDEAFEAWRQSEYDYRKGDRPDHMMLMGMIFGITNKEMRRDPRFLELCDSLGLCAYWSVTNRWPDCADDVPYDFRSEARKRVALREQKESV
jgi:TolB-like protein/DNA-binding SARP family transcriptional activator